MMHVSIERVVGIARGFARRATKMRRAEAWVDDVTQDVAVCVWEAGRRGYGSGPEQYRRFARAAVDRYLGDARYNGRAAQHVGEEVLASTPSSARPELAPLALHRLQVLWPTLSDAQRAGLFSALVGGDDRAAVYGVLSEIAADFGVPVASIGGGRRSALELLNQPLAVSRASAAKRQAIARARSAR